MNWKNLLITTILTALATLATGMLLSWWQTKEPELSYNVATSIPFDGSDGQLRISQVDISSSGKIAVEGVVLLISLPEGQIENHKVELDSAIQYKEEIGSDKLKLIFESLNPGEKAKVSLLFKQITSESSAVRVSLRGKGVVGHPQEDAAATEKISSLVIALISAYVGLLSAVLSMRRSRRMLFTIINNMTGGKLGGPTAGNQQENLASILAQHGFCEEANEYASSVARRRYWVEADVLTSKAIKSLDPDFKARMSLALQQLSLIESMATESRAVVLYNAAKLEHSIGRKDQFDSLISDAKKLNSKEIESRLMNDPAWSLSEQAGA